MSIFEFYTRDDTKVKVPKGKAFSWAFDRYPDGYIWDRFCKKAMYKEKYYEQAGVRRNTALVEQCSARMSEEINSQQEKDIMIEAAIEKAHQDLGLKPMKKNLKNAVGATKSPTSCIPSAGIFAMGAAMQDGGNKYEPFNYRETEVTASVFFNAMMRHLLDWWEGEDFADDSGVHHLGHLAAGAAIVLDGVSCGNLIDDRPKVRNPGASRKNHVWKKG